MKKILRKYAGVIAISMILGHCVLPTWAADKKEQMYILDGLDIMVYPDSEKNILYGGAVDENGIMHMERNKKYDFTVENTKLDAGLDNRTLVMNYEAFGQNYTTIGKKTYSSYYIGNDKWLYRASEESESNPYEVKLDFQDVYYTVDPTENSYEAPNGTELPSGHSNFTINGRCDVEIRFSAEKMFTLELPNDLEMNYDEIRGFYEQLLDAEDRATELGKLEPVVFRASFDFSQNIHVGRVNIHEKFGSGAHKTYYRFEIQIPKYERESDPGEKIGEWEVDFQGEKRTVPTYRISKNYISNGFEVKPLIYVNDWSIVEYFEGSDVRKNTLYTAGAAGGIGLGASIASNAVAGVQPMEMPKKRYGKDGEELEQDTEDIPDTEDLPDDLSEEDDPSVSLSIYKPFDALINTKGSAVDLQMTLSGGEGLNWHYIPSAVCIHSVKTVIPSIVNMGEKAELVLAMTGMPMKEKHSTVFVTVVAWARNLPGKIIKTSAVLEIPIHEKCLEAKRNEDGTWKVTSYADGNFDGIAEIKELNVGEYTVKEKKDKIIIKAKEKRLGSCEILKNKDE